MTQRYTVTTEDDGKGWSYIEGPNGYCDGPWRYKWEAEEYAEKLERGELAELPRKIVKRINDARSSVRQ